jgi:hypothetical protein
MLVKAKPAYITIEKQCQRHDEKPAFELSGCCSRFYGFKQKLLNACRK